VITCGGSRIAAGVVALVLLIQTAGGRELPGEEAGTMPRLSLGGGMGVTTMNPADLAAYVTGLTGTRVADFTAAGEFFGSATLPLTADWLLTLEYAYLLGGYSGPGGGEFTFRVHMPTLIVHYALVEEEHYNLRIGAGAGYHAGTLSVRYVTLNDEYRGSGPAMKLDCQANTALGEHLFARLEVDARWDFIGTLSTAAGRPLAGAVQTAAPTLHFFGVGAKLGASWFF
jgi:hypothetical protein